MDQNAARIEMMDCQLLLQWLVFRLLTHSVPVNKCEVITSHQFLIMETVSKMLDTTSLFTIHKAEPPPGKLK
jgi:hypothetical protein